MAQVIITINAREYAVVAEDGQEAHIIELAKTLDEKAKMITAATGQINENMLLAMVSILVADELNEAKKQQITNNQPANNDNLENLDKDFSLKIQELTAKIKSIENNI